MVVSDDNNLDRFSVPTIASMELEVLTPTDETNQIR